jgi:hypothetical protein
VTLLVRGRRRAGRFYLFLGIGFGLTGAFWWVIFLVLGWASYAFFGPAVAEGGLSASAMMAGSLDALVTLAPALMAQLLAVLYLIDWWQLRRIRLVIDANGISVHSRGLVVVEWRDVRHVAVAGDRPGRRLVVDTGTAPSSWWSARTLRPGRVHLRLLSRRRALAVNLPLDGLDVEAGDLLREIGKYTDVILPDRAAGTEPRPA